MMQFPGLDRVAQCRVTLTLEVDRDGSELALPRDTPVQFALMPNERSLGEGSLFLVRIEVNRLGP